ncbi:outer membrane protein assembly factor BamB family protein [Lignipirellula cremea]|uniref:Outer membrane biogenesis protein BamB n=1 Tax=Lignipirellula cremea TaxID=2528010 RepID=A0A518DX60_9BACT|nr:PQQ-binding-like beta-propeller repeat protein [Lignipirellula cremea]QDU96407.1 outer membrane biogenesis protein BamB [Lignipirellula cremea]
MRYLPALLVCLIFGSSATAADWNQYLGPQGDGHAAGTAPLTWSEQQNVAWKTPIHGKGWSSPVVWKDQIWLTTATEDGTRMYAVCLDKNSGKVIHDVLLFENESPDFCHAFNSYASPTPFVEEGSVYVHFGKYGTACLDTKTGEKRWERRDFACDHYRGPGASPIVHDGLLFVSYDGFDVQYLTALDKHTGETVWRKDREIKYESAPDDGDKKKAYSTAAIVTVAGKELLISPSSGATIAYEPKTGKEVWRCNHGGWNASIRPIFHQGRAIIDTHSRGLGTVAIRIDGKGDVSDTHIDWSHSKTGRQLPNPLLVDDLLYLVDSLGVMTVLDVNDGSVVWKHRLGGNFVGSPLYLDGRIYVANLEGETHVLAPGRTYQSLAVNKLDSGCMASPAATGDGLLLRTTTDLYYLKTPAGN